MEGLNIADWGLIPYEEAYSRQKQLFEENIQAKASGQKTSNTLIFCEHPHVITVGKHGLFSNLLLTENSFKEKNIQVFHIDRGGDVTYHGPGQIVVYPIVDLEALGLGLKGYIHLLEEAVIQLLKSYNINAFRLDGATGVWLDIDTPFRTRKICAMGVRCSRFITMHGLALNVNTDLDYFQLINPCGFTDKGVTSIEKELKMKVNENDLKKRLLDIFLTLFSENIK